ncbi:MAG: hypothetical protein JWL61_2738 [Gemmatimonadetes bacterium]|nr:hypothetical protein [Gemmatimonadota bacterium]
MLTVSLVAILIVALLAHNSGRANWGADERIARLLASRAIVVVVAATTFFVIWYSWAAIDPIPIVHDEMAMVLQAKIFARGQWALPSPPIPAFWEQSHVLVVPMLAAKYFPGHSLLMAIGALLGWTALIPLLLQAAAGALLYVLARRVGGGAVAFCAWVIWLSSPMVLHFGASYFAQVTSSTAALAAWYALLRWREARTPAWLGAAAFFVGWVTITRPLTGAAYVLPMAVVVLRDVIAHRRWRDLAVALAAGTAVIALIPLWSAKSTGDWRTTPQTLYTRQYMPWDAPGFGYDSTPPLRVLTAESRNLTNVYGPIHARHLPSTLAPALMARVQNLYVSVWGQSSGVMALFALVGLLTLRGPAAYALATSILVVVAHLIYATPPQWTLYYYETTPTFAYLSAAGLAWAAALIARPRGVPPNASFQWRSPRLSSALVIGALILAAPGVVALQKLRHGHIAARRDLEAFYALLRTIHDEKAVVFVRHAGMHNPHVAFVRNVPDLAKERIWVVYDRGEANNAALRKQAPARVAYLFDEQARRIYVYDPLAP